MDYYELHLLGLARERAIEFRWYPRVIDGVEWITVDGRFGADNLAAGFRRIANGPTLADALAALLTDLGVTVPERPKTAAFFAGLPRDEVRAATKLRDLYAREPLTVLALLEGGAS